MSIQEILELEKRNENNLFEIHFYLEGSFWKAYEWSAYLSRIFPSSLKDDERLKVLKKTSKYCEDGYIQVGLQFQSFKKYFPSVANEDGSFEVQDKHIIMYVKQFFEKINFSEYESILKEYKSKIELFESKKKKVKGGLNNTNEIDSLIQEVINYPIENKSLIESLNFLNYIKGKFINITKETK